MTFILIFILLLILDVFLETKQMHLQAIAEVPLQPGVNVIGVNAP